MEIHKSAEDYLETILKLRLARGSVRSVDVAEELHFSKPSVSVAMKKLRESGHVIMEDSGMLTLTETGEAIAARIYERHRILTMMLVALGVEEAVAAEEACQIEHVISDGTFEKIKQYFEEKTS